MSVLSRPRVCVILAIYNGERFLREQLDSLASQTVPPTLLVVRDDGSRDRSVEIVREWAEASSVELQFEAGERLGPAQSFLRALSIAGPAELYLFCDQDDVWLPQKIERALSGVPIAPGAPPVLYAACAHVVDEQLKFMRTTNAPRKLSFGSAACESLLTGCTMAFNRALRDKVALDLPVFTPMHDWWLYLVASAVGSINFDGTASILYRQHGGNALGVTASGPRAWRARIGRALSSKSAVRIRQLSELVRIHGAALDSDKAALAGSLLASRAGFGARLRAAFCTDVERQRLWDQLSTRLAILLNRF